MTAYREYLLSREYRRDMLSSAENSRLLRSIKPLTRSVAAHWRILMWTGRQLEALGRRLQRLSYPYQQQNVYNGGSLPVPRAR
ncbi:MAG: hypothetical protein H7175_10710 [Burkholderiales bacterium]|nr:hypothetical protein [Anaerolineae bacterium]